MSINREELIEKIRLNLVEIDLNALMSTGFKLSSVLVIIHFTDSIPKTILTKRSSKLTYHSNEISFPGGSFHHEDYTLLNTALRETKEEIGLDFTSNEIAGSLQAVKTLTSNYVIIPYITFQTKIYEPKILSDEVSSILNIPIFELLDSLSNNFSYKNFSNSFLFKYGQEIIWGATARIIKQIRDSLY
ncbi:MAG: NUDIX hydrolase [Nitrososphaeraceae archaeon]